MPPLFAPAPQGVALISGFEFSAQLPDGRWLTMRQGRNWAELGWIGRAALIIAAALTVLSLLALMFARQMAKPIQHFADAVQAVGVNPQSAPAQVVADAQLVPPTNIAIAVGLAARVREGSHRFDTRLDPPELGRIDVRLDVDKNGDVNTRLTVDRPETLDLLQRDARGLERALQSAGLKTEDGSLQFSLRQHSPDGSAGQQAQSGPNPRPVAVYVGEDESIAANPEQYQWAARLRGGVDIRV